METSRSDPTRADGYALRLPEAASDEEAAAIAAALEAYLADERAMAGEGREHSWDGLRWSFAGRMETLVGRPVKVPDGAPMNGWSAAGRSERF